MKYHYFTGFQTVLIRFLRGQQEVVGKTPRYQPLLSTGPSLSFISSIYYVRLLHEV